MTGIYVHIPFCKSRCIYCGFVSSTLGEAWQLSYMDALGKEMERRKDENGSTRARTIYIGGGTPSQLSPQAFEKLIELLCQNFQIDKDVEFTIEVNPDDITPAYVKMLRQSPVNRVSLGVQSLNDDILRHLHRRHTARQALKAIELLQEEGYQNISGDLIYGLPGQSVPMFQDDVKEILRTHIPHLSAYALQYEEGTPLWEMRQRGKTKEADEELSLTCYHRLIDLAVEAGMEHYEISNFACPGFRSRHNSSYWKGLPYLGLGAGAHSYDGNNTRKANTSDIKAYIAGGLETETEILTRNELYDERVMLSLRTCEGLSLEDVERDFGTAMRRHCEQQAEPHILRGSIKRTGENLCLTRSGLFISDGIITDLLA